MKHKKLWWGILGVVVVIAAGCGIYAWQVNARYQSYVDKASDVKKWTADPRPMQSEKTAMAIFQKSFKANKEVKNKNTTKGVKLTTIPGLRGAWSVNHKTKKAAFGNDWVPQGLTQSDDKYFVSLYDGDHKLNSLIVQIDKKTGKYEKSLILNSKAHVGGITYEDKYKQLIYSDDVGGYAGFGAIKQADIDSYDPAVAQKPIAAKKIEWHLGTRTSAITTYNGNMVVARYGQKSKQHSIILLPLDKNGLPKALSEKKVKEIDETIAKKIETQKVVGKDFVQVLFENLIDEGIINGYEAGVKRMQGVSMQDVGLTVLVQSNGLKNSKLILQEQAMNPKKWNKLEFAVPMKSAPAIYVPHAAEEVTINNDLSEISTIFESGAKKYREKGFLFWRPSFMDYFVTLPITGNGNDK